MLFTSNYLTIIGTVHVEEESGLHVRKAIRDKRPSVVAVELCSRRLETLRDHARKSPGSAIKSGLLVLLLTSFERLAGVRTGVFPGSEMLGAVEEAEKIGARVELIDVPIQELLAALKGIPLTEKIKLFIDSLMGILALLLRWNASGIREKADELMLDFERRYPTLHRRLVVERNRYMAERIVALAPAHVGHVVVVLGLGHVKGVVRELSALAPGLLNGS